MALIASILSKFDDSGIRKAKSSFGGLKKTIGALGIGIGLKQLTDGLTEVAKAASADQKSMLLLNTQLKKNANATDAQIKQNDKFIDSLSQQVGIVDDDLRPAMGKLVRATGDTRKAQQLLKLALDASVVSGKPLDTVAQALSKAALDGLLFYVFFEATLIPMYIIIGVWGGPNRVYAAFKFFLYTLLGSLLTLVAILYLYSATDTFNILAWHKAPLDITGHF